MRVNFLLDDNNDVTSFTGYSQCNAYCNAWVKGTGLYQAFQGGLEGLRFRDIGDERRHGNRSRFTGALLNVRGNGRIVSTKITPRTIGTPPLSPLPAALLTSVYWRAS